MPLRTLSMRRLQTALLLAVSMALAGDCDGADATGAVQSLAVSDTRLAAALMAEFPDCHDCPAPDDRGPCVPGRTGRS